MGSKTPEGYQEAPNGDSRNGAVSQIVKKPAGAKVGLDDEGDGGGGDDDDDDDSIDHGAQIEAEMNGAVGDANKKRKRKKKNKKKTKSPVMTTTQSSPPRVKISLLFPDENYPQGEMQPHTNLNLSRTTDEELRYLSRQDNMSPEFLSSYREAAEVHRQVRKHAQSVIFPGQSLSKIADEIEEGVRALTGHSGIEKGDALKAGMGFPTGLCLNNVAAHWTPNPRSKEVYLKQDDVLKVDFGVHVDGRIVDSAFTVAFDPTYDPLLESVKDATNTGIKHAGIDARMSDIGAAIQEVMENYEVTIHGKTHSIKSVRNITGHDILRYHIHGNKQVPFVKNKSHQKMEEGEVFAIETFGSTGKGVLRDVDGIYGYGRNDNVSSAHLHLSSAKSLLKRIDENFGSLVFSRRYLEHTGATNYLLGMNHLVSQGIVEAYQPLVDIKGSYVAQFEHTILLRSEGKEVISRGDDY